MNARVKDYGLGEVLKVIEWAHTSAHPRAVYLQSNGYLTPKTIFAPSNFAAYLEFAHGDGPKANGSRAKPAPDEAVQIVELLLRNPRSTVPEYAEMFGDRWPAIHARMIERKLSPRTWANATHDIERQRIKQDLIAMYQGFSNA